VVIVGTAFHWFQGEKALSEIARILKPRGQLCLLWNIRSMEKEWAREISHVLDTYEKIDPQHRMKWKDAFLQTSLFLPLSYYTYHYSFQGDSQDILSRLFSAKVMGQLTEDQRKEIHDEVLHILATNPETKGKKILDIPYQVEIAWCQKR
jgi:SAM-dependent methyltransferase